jgi:hypothetical protein
MKLIERIKSAEIQIDDVVGGNTHHLESLVALMGELFPDLVKYIPSIRRRAQQSATADPRFVAHQWIVQVEGRLAGICLFDYNIGRNCGMLNFLAIDRPYRQISFDEYDRLAHLLLELSLEQILQDALLWEAPPPVGLVLEVEVPKLVERYRDYGLVPLSVPYHEPIFPPAWTKYSDMVKLEEIRYAQAQLTVYPNPDHILQLAADDVQRELALAYLLDFYRLPETSWSVQQALMFTSRECN